MTRNAARPEIHDTRTTSNPQLVVGRGENISPVICRIVEGIEFFVIELLVIEVLTIERNGLVSHHRRAEPTQ